MNLNRIIGMYPIWRIKLIQQTIYVYEKKPRILTFIARKYVLSRFRLLYKDDENFTFM